MSCEPQKPTVAWQAFEHAVADLLALQGYTIHYDRILGARQTDMLAAFHHPTTTTTVLVECKHAARAAVGVKDVTDFCSRVNNARLAGIIDKGLLVTNIRYTRQAHAYVRENRAQTYVSLVTYAELERDLVDFTSYLHRVIDDFDRLPLSHYMVDLACTVSTGADERKCKSIADSVLHWIDAPDASQLCILGDFGSGKTSFSLFLTAALARKYLDSPSDSRIPILILLKEYVRAGSVQPMITDWLVNECGILHGTYGLFRRMLHPGRFVVILDGFDEMTMRTDLDTIHDNFRNLSELNCEHGKLVLTGRPGYFPDLDEMNRIIWGSDPARYQQALKKAYPKESDLSFKSVVLPSVRLSSKAQAYQTVWLAPLKFSHIKKIVHAREQEFVGKGYHPDDLLGVLRERCRLGDLASRPVLLDMIISTFAEMGPKLSVANTARLYDLYTDLWIDIDRTKGEFRRLISREDKVFFMEELAWEMYRTDVLKIHYAELPGVVEEHFGLEDLRQTDYFSHDIMTCSFLGRDDYGYYRFVHKSFMEYFAALKIYRELGGGRPSAIGEAVLSEEVVEFIGELSELDGHVVKPYLHDMIEEGRVRDAPAGVTGSVRTQTAVVGASNAIGILSRIEETLEGLDLSGVHLEHAHIRAGTDLRKSVFRKSLLYHVSLLGSNLDGCVIEKTSWQDVVCDASRATNAEVHDVVLTNVKLRTANLRASSFKKVVFKGCDLEDAVLACCVMEECQAVGVRFCGCDLSGLKAANCDFSTADFREARLTGCSLVDVDLTGSNLEGVDLSKTKLNRVQMKQARVRGATLPASAKRRQRGGKEREGADA